MSYILEALKRSEQERVRGAAPTLHVMHDEPLRESRHPWHYFAVPAVLVLVLIGWQRPWKADAAVAPAPALSLAMEMPIAPPQAELPAAPPSPSIAAAPLPEAPPAPAPKAVRHKEKKEKAAAEAKPAKKSKHALADTVPAMAAAVPEAEAPPRKGVVNLSELPSSVQRTLPKVAISGYINHSADPAERMVGVGDSLLREGDETSSGLKLEKIADTNAVFSFKGHRFRVPLP